MKNIIPYILILGLLALFGYIGFLMYKESTYPCDQLQYMKPNMPERCQDYQTEREMRLRDAIISIN